MGVKLNFFMFLCLFNVLRVPSCFICLGWFMENIKSRKFTIWGVLSRLWNSGLSLGKHLTRMFLQTGVCFSLFFILSLDSTLLFEKAVLLALSSVCEWVFGVSWVALGRKGASAVQFSFHLCQVMYMPLVYCKYFWNTG